MLILNQRTTAPATDSVALAYDERKRSRLKVTLASGAEAGIFLERGDHLHGGDRLAAEDGSTVVEILAAPESLIEAIADSPCSSPAPPTTWATATCRCRSCRPTMAANCASRPIMCWRRWFAGWAARPAKRKPHSSRNPVPTVPIAAIIMAMMRRPICTIPATAHTARCRKFTSSSRVDRSADCKPMTMELARLSLLFALTALAEIIGCYLPG
jgi:hypothetical protein